MSFPLVSRLSPFGPIFTKELRTTSRRKRNYFLRVAYLAALLLFLLLAYASGVNTSYGGAAMRAQRQAELGFAFFMSFSLFSVGAMAALGPVLTSTAISGERLHKTLHVLLMTPITSWQIVSGKLLSRLLTAFTLLGLSLPVLALVRLLGGVEVDQMVGVMCLCVVTVTTTAALGMALSAKVDRAYGVIILSYGAILFVYAFVPFVVALTFASGNIPRGTELRLMQIFAAGNPFFCTGLLASGEMPRSGIEWWPCVLIHLLLTGGLVMYTGVVLRRIARREGEDEGGRPALTPANPVPASPPEASALAGSSDAAPTPLAPLAYASGPPPLARATGRTVSDRPVLWRELRQPLLKRRGLAVVAGLCVLCLVATYALLAANDALNDEECQIGYACVFHGLLTLLACIVSATAIAQEKEGDTWTLLLTTPLSGSAIVWGKVLGVLRRFAWPLALMAGHFVLFVIGGVIDLDVLLLVGWVVVTFNVLFVATGVYFSLRFAKVTFAVVVNLMLPVVMYIVTPVALVILGELLIGGSAGNELPELMLWYLPYYYLGEYIDSASRATTNAPWFDENIARSTFFWVAICVGVVHVWAALAVVLYTQLRFDRIVGRAGQAERVPRSALRRTGPPPYAPLPPAGEAGV